MEASPISKWVTLALVALLVAIPAASALKAELAPIDRSIHVMLPANAQPATPASGAAPINLTYGGGPVLANPIVFITYWDWHATAPTGAVDPAGEAAYMESFFSGIGGTPWANIQTQYYGLGQGFIKNPTNQLGGVWYDDSPLPPPVASVGTPVAIANVEIAAEAKKAEQHFGYHADALYIIALPHLDDVDFAGAYCAYHSNTVDDHNRLLAYADMPYIPDMPSTVVSCGQNLVNSGARGTLDGVSIVGGHEYAEAVTDARPNSGWSASDGENGDKCAWISSGPARMQNLHLSTGDFAVQSLWSNADHGCVIGR